MSYSLEQLLSGKKVVCRNGLVPNMIIYFSDCVSDVCPKGLIVIEISSKNTESKDLIVLDAATGYRFKGSGRYIDNEYELLLTDESSEIPILTISPDKMGFVNLYQHASSPSGLDPSFLYNTKKEADKEDILNDRNALGTVFY